MKILIYFLFLAATATAQVGLGLYQDAKLLVSGDGTNPAPAVDLIIELNLDGKQYKTHYFTMKACFEYAKLDSNFARYSVHAGWVFNKWYQNFEYGIFIGAGLLHRGKDYRLGGLPTASVMGEINYLLNPKLKLAVKYEVLYRTDLKNLWGSSPVKPNLALGVKYTLFN